MTTDTTNNGFSLLWPTPFLQRRLPDTSSANSALLQLLLELEQSHSQAAQQSGKDLTTDYLNENLFNRRHPAIDWLRQCANKTVADYFSQLKMTYNIEWTLQGWGNINRRGDYHNLHNHPHSYLSGTYYVKVPQQSDPQASFGRSDLNPGAISFYDPRAQANMTAIKGDPQIDPELCISPTEGLMLLWPSFLHHMVHPNLADDLRVSVSFNVLLKDSDRYLPAN